MIAEPLCRARHLKSVLEFTRQLPQADQQKLRQRVGQERLARIAEAASSDWLPAQVDFALTRSIHDVLGPDRTRIFFHDHQLRSLHGPLFRIMTEAAVKLFGPRLDRWARWIPKGWNLVFRHCGRWRVASASPGWILCVVEDLPSQCSEDRVWLSAVAGSMSALLDVVRCSGTFLFTGWEKGSARYEMRWDEAPAAEPEQGAPGV